MEKKDDEVRELLKEATKRALQTPVDKENSPLIIQPLLEEIMKKGGVSQEEAMRIWLEEEKSNTPWVSSLVSHGLYRAIPIRDVLLFSLRLFQLSKTEKA